MFKPNNEKIQKDMFDAELQQGTNQGILDYDSKTAEQDMVEIAQRRENDDLTRWQQDMEGELKLVTYKLKRWYYDEDKDGWRPLPGDPTGKTDDQGNAIYHPIKPMMNDRGINYFVTTTIPSLSRNLMMSNYDQDKIFMRLKRIVITFIHHLAYHYKEYEIEEGDLSAIVGLLKDIIEPAHWRSLNNGERAYLNTVNKRMEVFSHGQQQAKPKGFLAGLLG